MSVFIPQGCKTSRSIPACRILKNCISTDLLETLNNIIVEYFFYLDKINWLYIFKKRFGLNGNQPVLLSDIGKEYNITRERTRQILFIMTSQIRKLLEGKELSKPRIVCKKINLFESFKNSLTSKIYTFDRIKRVLVENYTKISADYYIDLLMFLYGYEIISYENKKIYYKDISFFKIKKNIHLFRVFLSKRALFVSQNEIKNTFKLIPQELEFYLEFISNIETKEDNGKIFYRMPLKDLQRSSIRTYRILYEAGHPMRISDIETELIKNGCKVDLGRNRCADIIGKEEIIPIGRSGEWALREWGMNTESIPCLIEKCLHKKNSPLTLEQVFNCINEYRRVSRNIIQSTFCVYIKTGNFVQYIDNTYGLKSWKLNKPLKFRRHNIYKRKSKQNVIINKALKILRKKKKMPLKNLREELLKEDYSMPTIYKALESPLFIKEEFENNREKYIYLKKETV